MELTRRDVLAALAAASAGCGAPEDATGDGVEGARRLVALAAVLYPSELTGVESFVRDYSLARVEGREEYRAGMEAALDELDEHAEAFHGAPFADLPREERDTALRELRVDEADPDPAGAPRERIRYYLVNELLFALYATPTGGKLVGTPNPPGHPGGTSTYQGARR